MYEVTLFRRATNKPDERGREHLKIPKDSWKISEFTPSYEYTSFIERLISELTEGDSITITRYSMTITRY